MERLATLPRSGTARRMLVNQEHSLAKSLASKSSNSTKRGLNITGLGSNVNLDPLKSKAAKTCAPCRARRIRCDVVPRNHITADGVARCSNCIAGGIQCVLEERRQRRKSPKTLGNAPADAPAQPRIAECEGDPIIAASDDADAKCRSCSKARSNGPLGNGCKGSCSPRPTYQTQCDPFGNSDIFNQRFCTFSSSTDRIYALLISASIYGDRTRTRLEPPRTSPTSPPQNELPGYLKPLPLQMAPVDIDCLYTKAALSLPESALRDALLRSYMQFVHPELPIIEIRELLRMVNREDGDSGRVSLLLFQAVMFAGASFVDMKLLRSAGYSNRRDARNALFQKVKVLYDFDYETDRVCLVQSLLLMTYGCETPQDQKDAWHWMGIALSLAYTIGLHRDPQNASLPSNKKSLRKLIWWSCFMRDQLIALEMRRPTRVKGEDYDVPMLTEVDFEIQSLPQGIEIISKDCFIVTDICVQRDLARMCIAKAKLCLCISRVLSTQYSVVSKRYEMQRQERDTQPKAILLPKKLNQKNELESCNTELSQWLAELPECCVYTNEIAPGKSGPSLFVQRSLLQMVYFTTVSALHRPHVLPWGKIAPEELTSGLRYMSLKKVREASRAVTRISRDLYIRGLDKYLPVTGVTVLIPAVIIHVLDAKSLDEVARQAAVNGFRQCMLVLETLSKIYPTADSAIQFIEALLHKANFSGMLGNARDKIKYRDANFGLGGSNEPQSLQNLQL